MKNKIWADKILKHMAPDYRHRWDIYEHILRGYLGKDKIWVDLGCGHNADVEEKKDLVSFAAGLDVIKNEPIVTKPFLISDIEQLPLKSESVDVCSLRFVMEHIADPARLMHEMDRILRPGGVTIFMTTNIWSPLIFLPKALPYTLRKKIILKIFGAQDEDIFPTYHRFNSPRKLKNKVGFQALQKCVYIQDLNAGSKVLFILFLAWHFISKPGFLNILRSNFIAVYQK